MSTVFLDYFRLEVANDVISSAAADEVIIDVHVNFVIEGQTLLGKNVEWRFWLMS